MLGIAEVGVETKRRKGVFEGSIVDVGGTETVGWRRMDAVGVAW